METILQIKNLSKSFGKKQVIKNISFDVYEGEVFGFLGPNGAGKTTTIKMVMGFLFPDNGQIIINGADISKDYEKAMSYIGGIVENPEMYKDLSGRINIEMYARLHDGVSPQRIDEVISLVGMQDRINDKVKKYSLGMKQRVGLAQALVHHPKVLILDEPTNGLDPVGIHELRDILKKLAHEEGVAVIVSSHILSEMQLMCDRVGIITNGNLLGVKSIDDMLDTSAHSYRFAVKDTDVARSALAAFDEKILAVGDGFLDLNIEEDEIPAVNLALAQSSVAVFGITKNETSLEEAFLDITGGGMKIE